MLSQSSTTKLISSLSSKKAIIAQVIDFILHVVYNKRNRKRSHGESRNPMPFAKKAKKDKILSDYFCRQINNHYI